MLTPLRANDLREFLILLDPYCLTLSNIVLVILIMFDANAETAHQTLVGQDY